MAAVTCSSCTSHNYCSPVISFQTTIKKMEWRADHATINDVLDSDSPFIQCLGIVGCVSTMRNLYGSDLLGCSSIVVHMSHKSERITLPCTCPSIRSAM